MSPITDAELVEQTRSGDMTAYNRLARRWESGLYRFALRILGNAEDARDVSQEALIKAYTNIGRLRDPAKFKSWVFHIVLNLCRDRKRSPRHRPGESWEEGTPLEWEAVERTPSPGPEAAAHRAGVTEMVSQALSRLPAEQRTAILLKEYQGFTSEEVGEITGVPAATVRTRIFYGLKRVRVLLHESGVDRDVLS